MAYTTKQVRDALIGRPESEFGCGVCGGTDDDIKMLKEYADRLEQDEQHLRPEPMPKGLVYGGMKYEVWRPDQEVRVTVEESETYRRGQLEVYREIAAMTLLPIEHDYSTFKVVHSTCAFCGREPIAYQIGEEHAPDCLWLRATAALRETTPTP